MPRPDGGYRRYPNPNLGPGWRYPYARVPPISRIRYLPSRPGMGYPLIQTWDGVCPDLMGDTPGTPILTWDLDGGTPMPGVSPISRIGYPHPDLRWGTPAPEMVDKVKNITYRRPSDADGKKKGLGSLEFITNRRLSSHCCVIVFCKRQEPFGRSAWISNCETNTAELKISFV